MIRLHGQNPNADDFGVYLDDVNENIWSAVAESIRVGESVIYDAGLWTRQSSVFRCQTGTKHASDEQLMRELRYWMTTMRVASMMGESRIESWCCPVSLAVA